MEVQENKGIVTTGDTNLNESVVGISSDIHVTYYQNATKIEREEIFKRSKLISEGSIEFQPVIEEEVINKLNHHRTVILSFDESVDQLDYKRSLFELIHDQNPYEAYELVEDFEDQSIFKAILKGDDRLFYFLDDIDVSHINYDLKELQGIATRKSAYLIITTASPKVRWQACGGDINDIWVSVKAESIYSADSFRGHFLKELLKCSFIKESESIKNQLVSKTITVDDVLARIKHPMQFLVFLDRYRRCDQLPDDSWIQNALNEVEGCPDEIIERWFQKLSNREKLIAVAFSAFEGMYISQFFEALSELLPKESLWRISEPDIVSIDLKDISFLEPFVHNELSSGNGVLISSKPNFRNVLFKIFSKTHRRHLMAFVSANSELVYRSYTFSSVNWELLGTYDRRGKIRKAFVNTISDLGKVLFDLAEHILLDLAVTNHHHVQNLVASSLVRWRRANMDEQFFALIDRWRNDDTILDLVHEKLLQRKNLTETGVSDSFEAADLIKATIAITVSRATQYDERDKLDSRLIGIYGEIANDPSDRVQFAIEKSLPKFIHKHINQLKSLLFENLMKTARFRKPIAAGLFLAYQEQKEEIKSTLDQWLDQCLKEKSEENRRDKTTYRDNVLITILNVIINALDDLDLRLYYSDKELYKLVMVLLRKEGRREVRDITIQLLVAILRSHPGKIQNFIERLEPEINDIDRRKLVQQLTQLHLYQLSKLKGGDVIWEFQPKLKVPVWFDRNERPLTAVETEMLSWINNAGSAARKMATLFFLNVASSFEEYEFNFIKEELTRRKIQESQVRSAQSSLKKVQPIHHVNSNQLDFFLRIRIFIALIFETKENREALKETLLVVKNAGGINHFPKRIMNHKWRNRSPQKLAGKLGKWLERYM